jgi:hypothetical protein
MVMSSTPAPSPVALTMTERTASSDFQQLVSEHTLLMEQAIHEDDAILVPLIEDFIQRCRSSHAYIEQSEYSQRLTSHLQYWEAFLKALHQSP